MDLNESPQMRNESALLPDYDPNSSDSFIIWFTNGYYPIHGYLSLIVCVFGIVSNVANIIVLTRKELISPTNAILTGLAVTDMLVMVDYVPFTLHIYIGDKTEEERFSYGWAVFALCHAHFTVVCHTISIWLTVLLAVWRYIAVSYPTESKIWCSMKRTVYFIVATYILVILCCTPLYLCFTISERTEPPYDTLYNKTQYMETEVSNITTYKVGFSSYAQDEDGPLRRINFWFLGVAFKFCPCIVLTYLSLTLIRALVEADERKKRLKNPMRNAPAALNAATTDSPVSRGPDPKNSSPSHTSINDRTNLMLVAVLLLFLITEFPAGIILMLSGILGGNFFQEVYIPLGEFLDALALINSSVNFILYCTMSSIFRKTFIKLFCSCLDKEVTPPSPPLLTLRNTTINTRRCSDATMV